MIRTKKLGAGTYGTILGAKVHKNDTTEIAVKRNIIDSDISFSGSIREMDLLNRLRGHPFIIKLISVSFGNPFTVPNSPIDRKGSISYREDYLHFIFEKADKNLHDIIYENNIHVGYLKLSMVQILLSVEYMHAKGVIHRDIKPANLLWFENKNKTSVKLCDFGLSKIKTKQEPSSPHVVTCWYRAPEICSHNSEYSFPSDIWSTGCVFYEMIARNALLIGYKDDDNKILSKIIGLSPSASKEDIFKLTNGNKISLTKEASPKKRKTWGEMIKLKLEEIDEFNEYPGDGATYEEFLDLLDKMLKLDPDDRLTATEALNHPFFKPYENIITWSRSNSPPIKKGEIPITIIDCIERKWMMQSAFKFFNERDTLSWYKHRILYQSIDIFDRYLVYCEGTKETKIPSVNNGKYMTKDTTILRYMVCLYMSIKYFTTLSVPISFTELVDKKYKTKKALIESEDFEQRMLRDVLKFKIYRETVYEAADHISLILDEYKIRDITEQYGKISSKDILPSRLLQDILLLIR